VLRITIITSMTKGINDHSARGSTDERGRAGYSIRMLLHGHVVRRERRIEVVLDDIYTFS
jgi:hypothetical protein